MFYQYCKNRIYFDTDYIITFAVLIAGLCVGLPALVWVIYQHCKNRGYSSAFIILLIINDLIELPLAVMEVIGLGSDRFFIIFRINGVYLHQLVALESILSYKHKNLSDFFCSTQCSIILCIILLLIIFGCQTVRIYIWLFNTVLCILPFCILAVTCTLTCKAPPPNRDPAPPTRLKPGSAVLTVATLTLFAFTVQAVAVIIISHLIDLDWEIDPIDSYYCRYWDIYLFFAFLVSLRVILDPLLCVLVCKEKLRAQTQQTHSELNTEHQSV